MSFFGLFGHDKNPAAGVAGLPPAPPSASGGPVGTTTAPLVATPLPAAPPSVTPTIWDKDHRRDTLLGIGQGFLSGFNFQDGLGAAVGSLRSAEQGLRKQAPVLGGPDDAFEVAVDPVTGQHTYKPVQAFQDYLEKKRTKAKDTADLNGRVMYAIQQLPEEQRAAAYADVKAHPEHYGVDASAMPDTYNPSYGAIAAGTGMTVAQSMTRKQASDNAASTAQDRSNRNADRARRTDAYVAHSEAGTAQGAERVAQGAQRVGLAVKAGARADHAQAAKAAKGNIIAGYEYRRTPDGKLQRRKVQ